MSDFINLIISTSFLVIFTIIWISTAREFCIQVLIGLSKTKVEAKLIYTLTRQRLLIPEYHFVYEYQIDHHKYCYYTHVSGLQYQNQIANKILDLKYLPNYPVIARKLSYTTLRLAITFICLFVSLFSTVFLHIFLRSWLPLAGTFILILVFMSFRNLIAHPVLVKMRDWSMSEDRFIKNLIDA